MVLLLIGMTSTWAQEKAYCITAAGACDVTISQADTLHVSKDNGFVNVSSTTIELTGVDDYSVTLPNLESLCLYGACDVRSHTTLTGEKLVIDMAGSTNTVLEVDYDSIDVRLGGSCDICLKGRCRIVTIEGSGFNNIDTDELKYDTMINHMVNLSKWNQTQENTNISLNNHSQQHHGYMHRHSHKEQRNLLFDANWNGFEAGLNILTPGIENWNAELPSSMELRQMRSWCFDINIADVGIRFNRRHSIGLFTGIGIAWNNYCFANPVYFWKGNDGTLQESAITDEVGNELNVDRSKIGVFYAQLPLMFEFRPFHQNLYIDLGVTGGMRLTSWQTIRFGENPASYAMLVEGDHTTSITADEAKYLEHRDLCVNFFKLDATLRVGSVDDNLGLFVKYALLPVFAKDKGPEVYPISIGLSINF